MDVSRTTSYQTEDQLFPDRSSESAFYVDQGHSRTEVQYLPGTPQEAAHELPYASRDDMLKDIAKQRMRENRQLWKEGKINLAERYSGFEDGLKSWITGVALRIFYIISNWSVDKGLLEYDLHLLGQPKTLAYINFSVKEVHDAVVKPHVDALPHTSWPHYYTISRWHHNGENGRKFIDEDGKERVVQNAVSSSNDRTSLHVVNMRCVEDYMTRESVFYTGRADTERKSQEQLQFIFESEMARNPMARKGLKKTEDGYEMTVMVDNLMSSNGFLGMGLTALTGLDEKDSVERERALYKALAEKPFIELTDKYGFVHKVRIKPVYFNQGYNFLTNLGTTGLQKEINQEGYNTLFEMIDHATAHDDSINPKDKKLLASAKRHLENPQNLNPEEETFYRDLVAKILKIPMVKHCKSSVDRTSLAGAHSAALQGWRNDGRDIPEDHPHELLSDPIFRDVTMANLHANHQATYVSRSAEGIVAGEPQLHRQLGFEWGKKSGFRQNPIVRRMLPDRYLDETRKKFNFDNPQFGARGLIKKPGMKIYYKKDKTNGYHPLIQEQTATLARLEEERMARIRRTCFSRAA
ncbi:MAG: hypothetical protein KDK64_06150 [Chlamydiia bacterium]|nr:hypothetical protein [Chlamydiia bacterium]